MTPLILAVAVASVTPGPPPATCSLPKATPSHSQSPARARKLAVLPDANAIRAVLRTVDGCAYQDIIRLQVSRAGPVYPSGTLAPVQDRIAPVPTGDSGR